MVILDGLHLVVVLVDVLDELIQERLHKVVVHLVKRIIQELTTHKTIQVVVVVEVDILVLIVHNKVVTVVQV